MIKFDIENDWPNLEVNRFTGLQNSYIDYEANPLTFVMETNAKFLKLRYLYIRNKHQYWTENLYQFNDVTLPFPIDESIRNNTEKTNHILSNRAIEMGRKDICITSEFQLSPTSLRPEGTAIVGDYCGTNEVEFADWISLAPSRRGEVNESRIFNQPPLTGDDSYVFYGETTNFFKNSNYSITAMTTIPLNLDEVRVIMIYTLFKDRRHHGHTDDTFLVSYDATFDPNNPDGERWTTTRSESKPVRGDVNFIDDMAYLHSCGTILVIYGPLYNEIPPEFITDINRNTTVGSIDRLGLNEMVNAFFANPDERHIYFYHRTNYVAKHEYTCAKNRTGTSLVTAKKLGNYKYRHGKDMFEDIFRKIPDSADGVYNYYEEKYFQDLDIFRGDIGIPDAPDVLIYSNASDDTTSILILLSATIAACLLAIALLWGFLFLRLFLQQQEGDKIDDATSQINKEPEQLVTIESHSDLGLLNTGVATIRSEIQQGKMSTNAKKVGKFIVATTGTTTINTSAKKATPMKAISQRPISVGESSGPVSAKTVKMSKFTINSDSSLRETIKKIPAPVLEAQKQTVKKTTKKQALMARKQKL